MAIVYYPFDAGAGSSVTEAQWMKLMRGLMTTGVFYTGRSEVDLNLFEVYGDSSGMQVKVKSGAAWIQGFFVESDAESIQSISAADATYDRIDLVVLKLDRTANTISIAVLTGTPAASPAAPTPTQNSTTWEMVVAQVDVAATVTTITAGDVTDLRIYAYPSYLERRKIIPVIVFQSNTQASVGDGIDPIPVSSELSGYKVIDFTAVVHTKGVTGTMDIQLRRRRAGSDVDVMTTKITMGDEFYAKDGTVNAANAGLLLGDLMYVDVDTVHTTPAYGLSVLISLERDISWP